MTIREISDHWESNIKNSQAAVECWNSKASTFAARELPTAENSLAMRLILDNQMVELGRTALDVGCGCGRFSFALEQLGSCIIRSKPRVVSDGKTNQTQKCCIGQAYCFAWDGA